MRRPIEPPRSRPTTPSATRAFSLVEVMVVVAILGIAAALAVPKLLPLIHVAQLDGDAEAAASFIARARLEAMLNKRCTRVYVGAPTPNAKITATVGSQLVLERMNSFDCDNALPPASEFIQASPASAFIGVDILRASSASVQFSVATAAPDNAIVPADPASAGSVEIRFRPNGRVFSNDGNATPATAPTNVPVLNNDDAVVVVKHNAIINNAELANDGGRRRVLVQGNGLVCLLNRGTATPPGAPRSCPP